MGILDKLKKTKKIVDKKIESVKTKEGKEEDLSQVESPVSEQETEQTRQSKTNRKQKEVKNDKQFKKEAYKVIIRPIITEKSTREMRLGKYVFEVAANVNKIQVQKAFKHVYGVVPLQVNIVNLPGKVVRFGRIRGKRKDWKKAIITLPKGKSINLENV